jgi:hypothetical protein
MKIILVFLGAAIFVFSSHLVLLYALSFLGGLASRASVVAPQKKDAASIRARKDVFVFIKKTWFEQLVVLVVKSFL